MAKIRLAGNRGLARYLQYDSKLPITFEGEGIERVRLYKEKAPIFGAFLAWTEGHTGSSWSSLFVAGALELVSRGCIFTACMPRGPSITSN